MDQPAPSPPVRSFERHLRALNRSQRTIETYLISLRQAYAFLRAPSTAATYHKVLKLLSSKRWVESRAAW